MNRLLLTASRSAASSLRTNRTVPPAPAIQFPSARRFSDAAEPPPPAEGDDDSSVSDFKTGFVKYFSVKNSFGFIVPDGVDPDPSKHATSELCFIHRNDIKTPDQPDLPEGEEGEKFFPILTRDLRVRFRVGPPEEGKVSPKAYDLTLEGGEVVPPFQPGFLKGFEQRARSRFGDRAWEIVSTGEGRREELLEEILAAYDEEKAKIERQESKVKEAQRLTGRSF